MISVFKKCLFTSLILLLTGFDLYAQDSTLIGTNVTWDLAKCIDYAKKNNIQINTLQLSQQISQQELLLARASRLPNLSGSASQNFVHNDGNGFNANGSLGLSS